MEKPKYINIWNPICKYDNLNREHILVTCSQQDYYNSEPSLLTGFKAVFYTHLQNKPCTDPKC